MKINFPALFQTPLEKYRFFLLFGNDTSVLERALLFLQKNLKATFAYRNEEDFLLNPCPPPSLFEPITTSSFVVVPTASDKVLPLLDELKSGIYIFISEKARAQSKLVNHFAQTSACLAVASYAAPLIQNEFNFLVDGFSFSPTTKNLLFKAYQNDVGGLYQALEKIKIFGEFSENQLQNFLPQPSVSEDFSPFIHAFLRRDRKTTVSQFPALSQTEVISFLRSSSRSFQSLLELLSFKGGPHTIPWNSLTMPIFFKEKPFYEEALSRWSRTEVQDVLQTLLSFEKMTKNALLTYPHLRHKLFSFLSA